MKVRGFVGLFLAGLAALVLAGPVASSRAACPNEALRQSQRATFLPECRAFEMVSPADKNGANVSQAEIASGEPRALASLVTADGNGISYVLSGPLKDAEAYPLYNFVRSSRASDWMTRSMATKQTPWPVGTMMSTSVAISASTTLDYSELGLVPGAVTGNGNLYLRDSATGAYTLVASYPSPAAPTYEQQAALAVGRDFAVFGQPHALTPEANEYTGIDQNLYSFYGGELHLLNDPASVAPVYEMQDSRARYVSEDGSRVYFKQAPQGNPQASALYLSENGAPGRPISVSRRPGDLPAPVPAELIGASADGSVAYFTSFAPLTANAEPNRREVIYRYTVADDELVAVTLGPEPYAYKFDREGQATPVSEDGSYLYFIAQAALAPGGVTGSQNIYAWHDGETRLVASFPEGFQNDPRPFWSLSSDGTKLAFVSLSSLTGYDNASGSSGCDGLGGACGEVFVYDWSKDQLHCASCPPAGEPARGHATVGGIQQLTINPGQRTYSRSIRNDGTVFFDTQQKLVASDTNGKRDVYSFQEGAVSLISTGRSPSDSVYHGMNPSGTDVFFGTEERLVAADTDAQVDMYDARVGGGLASQGRHPSTAPCAGSGCQGTAEAPPPPPAVGSSEVRGDGNASNRRDRGKRCSKKPPSRRAQKGKKKSKKAGRQGRRAVACRGGNR
ncbi:MAG TPA: hypothetical protein VFX85_10305 [Solirubrobacterales bacterium]|nr:hypothetical protein [Solirubrobacterales bacterium]